MKIQKKNRRKFKILKIKQLINKRNLKNGIFNDENILRLGN